MARLPRTLRFRCGFAAAGAAPGPERHRGRGAAAVRTGGVAWGDVMGRVGGVSRRRCRAGRARDGAGGAAGPAGPAAGWLPAAPGLAPTPVRAGAAPLGSGRLGTCGVPAGTGAALFFKFYIFFFGFFFRWIWFGCSFGLFVDFFCVVLFVSGFFAGEAHRGRRRCCRRPLGRCRLRAPGEGSRQLRGAGSWTAAAPARSVSQGRFHTLLHLAPP